MYSETNELVLCLLFVGSDLRVCHISPLYILRYQHNMQLNNKMMNFPLINRGENELATNHFSHVFHPGTIHLHTGGKTVDLLCVILVS